MKNCVQHYLRPAALLLFAALLGTTGAHAQQLSLKTNLLSDAITVPSLGAEYALAQRWTASLDVEWMPLRQSSGHYLRTFKLQPEAHFWLRAPFTGPYVGPSLSWRLYNMGGVPLFNTRHARTQGLLLSVGAAAGWHFTLSDRWGLEPALTVGYAYADYRRYDAPRDTHVRRTGFAHYFGLTSLSLHLVYMLR